MHAFEVKESILGIYTLIKSCFYSEKCSFCELVVAFWNILQAISGNMKFDFRLIANLICLIKYYFKIIQFKLEATIGSLFKFLKCKTIILKEDLHKSFTRKFFFLKVPIWPNIIIRHSSELIKSSNEIE